MQCFDLAGADCPRWRPSPVRVAGSVNEVEVVSVMIFTWARKVNRGLLESWTIGIPWFLVRR